MEIRPGEVFGLLGPNGSGKTTTIKMLLGLLYPTRGRISLFGKSPSDVAVKARIGFLPEESYLYRFLVAHETLDYYGRLFRLPARVRKERADRLLDMVGLRQEAKRPIGEYSKGMARRIGLAQALMNDPEFLILDEPTSGLDPIGARQIKDVIRALGKKGKTILLSSHMLADVEDVCDRVTILYGGQQRAVGEVGDLLRQRDITQITAPSLSPETLDQVKKLVSRLEKRDILEVSNPRVKLEDFFMKIVQEAQAANIKTSGARSGGAVPEFLEKATASTTDQIIESLVEASAHNTEPVLPAPEAIVDPRSQAAKIVLNELISGSQSEEESPTQEPHPARPQQPAAPAPQVSADQSVLDALMGGDDGEKQKPADQSDKS